MSGPIGVGIGIWATAMRSGGGGGTPAPDPMTALTWQGDSRSVNSDATNAIPLWMADNPGVTVNNASHVGRWTGYPTDTTDLTNSLWSKKYVPVNDGYPFLGLWAWINGFGQADVAKEDNYDYTMQYIAYQRANNPNLTTVIVATEASAATNSLQPAVVPEATATKINGDRAYVNPLLRAAVGNEIDVLVPIGEAFTDTDMANHLWSDDGLHMNGYGQTVVRRVIDAVLDPLAAGASGSNPTAFTLTDQNNVPPGDYAYASFVVTGMGPGETCTVAASGTGEVARGRAAHLAGTYAASQVCMNGDVAYIRVPASLTAGAQVSSTVTAGSRSDTFTVTTEEATAVTFAQEALQEQTRPSNNDGPYSFATVAFPAGRPILATMASSITAVTVDGLSCTLIAESGESGDSSATKRLRLWVAPVGTDLAAGNYAVVVTASAFTYGTCIVYPGALQNSAINAVYGEVRKINLAARQGNEYTASGGILNVSSGGLIVGMLFEDSATDAEVPNATLGTAYAAKDTTGGSFTALRARWLSSGASGPQSIITLGTYSSLLVASFAVEEPDVTAPTITSANPSGSYAEGVGIGGTLTANETVTWSKSGTDAALVTLNTSTGVWSLPTTDYETKTSYSFTFTATDGASLTTDQVVSITITNVNEITLVALGGTFSLADAAAPGTTAGALTGVTSGSTLSLTDDAGGRVALSGSNIVAGATAVDYETATSHSFTVRETIGDATNSPRDTVLTLTVTAAGSGYEPETDTYVAAMSVAPTTAQKDTIDALIAGLKADGVWTKLDALYLLHNHDAQAARLNAVAPGTFDLTANNSPTFTAYAGYAGNGTTSYLDTGFNPSTASSPKYTRNSGHMGYWSKTSATNGNFDVGQFVNVSGATYLGARNASANAPRGRINASSNNNFGSSTADGTGHYCLNRTGSVAEECYRNGTSLAPASNQASLVVASANFDIGRAQVTYSTRQIAIAHIGSGLTATEVANMHSRFSTFITNYVA